MAKCLPGDPVARPDPTSADVNATGSYPAQSCATCFFAERAITSDPAIPEWRSVCAAPHCSARSYISCHLGRRPRAGSYRCPVPVFFGGAAQWNNRQGVHQSRWCSFGTREPVADVLPVNSCTQSQTADLSEDFENFD